jgi:choline dehydrogenase-like flavoprotein
VSLPLVQEGAPDPHRGVRVFAEYAGALQESCEVLVVGSGPGGAVVAHELARAGKDVILVEEGPPFGLKDLRTDGGETIRRTLREGGMRVARGNAYIPTMQAIALGGGSLVNSAISCRAPGWALDEWADKHGLGDLGAGSLDAHYRSVEEFLGIAATPMDVMGERNLVFKRGCDALGYSSEPTPRNVRGCRGSGECFTGCRNGAKQSTDVSYVPAAIRAGARVYTSVRADVIVADGRRARLMRGRVVEPFTGRETHEVEIAARHIVLAAGCHATPLILLRSGLANSSGLVGENLGFHPGLAIMGVFEHKIDPWAGATQGYHSLHFLREGMKLEVLWAPPGILAVRFPGFGDEFMGHLLRFDHMAPFDVFVAPKHSRGRVRLRRGRPEPDLTYSLDPRDTDLLQRGMAVLADICWAAGARAVMPGIHGVPDVVTAEMGTAPLRARRLSPRDATISSNHVFGTTRMGRDPGSSVTDSHGRCHDTDNLWISDTGLFPDSTAVNPMLTCMALAHRVARRIAEA